MNKLSVVISAFNAQSTIKPCLESAKFADEIIFVDNGSTDNTSSIAKEYTKHVFHQTNNPQNIDKQKNFGIQKAAGDWILVLDSDEAISPELKMEIKSVIKGGVYAGFEIPRKNIIFGKWIQHTGWYPDYQTRLFKKGRGKYASEHVHQQIKVDGNLGKLQAHILHENYDTVSQFLYKSMMLYAPNEAESKIKTGYVFNFTDAIRFPLKEFLNRYFIGEGYKDGFHGFMLSLLMASYHLSIFSYLWEKSHFQSIDSSEFEGKIAAAVHDGKKEFKYWLLSRKISDEQDSFKKFSFKIRRLFNI